MKDESQILRKLCFRRGVARSPVNIQDGGLCNKDQRLLAVNYCPETFHLCGGPAYASVQIES